MQFAQEPLPQPIRKVFAARSLDLNIAWQVVVFEGVPNIVLANNFLVRGLKQGLLQDKGSRIL